MKHETQAVIRNLKFAILPFALLAVAPAFALIRGMSTSMPASIYRELEFTDRAAVDRAQKLFNEAADAERRGAKAQDLIPRYRAAVAEWKKVQVAAEGGDYNQQLIGWATLMQAYGRFLAHDRNEAAKLLDECRDLYSDEPLVYWPAVLVTAHNKIGMGDLRDGERFVDEYLEDPKRVTTYAGQSLRWERHERLRAAGKEEAAFQLARDIYENGKNANENWHFARNYIQNRCIEEKRWADLERIYLAGVKADDKAAVLKAKADFLRRVMGRMPRAEVLKRIEEQPDKLTKLWLVYNLDEAEGQWKALLLDLDQIAAADKEYGSGNDIKYKRAWIYRDRLRDFPKALEVAATIDDPPRSLRELQWCQRLAGKKQEAYKTLIEITSAFPNDAAWAVCTTARYREEDGEKEKAIALYKRILKHPEWKKSPEASTAHQALERHGIATGGAMINAVR